MALILNIDTATETASTCLSKDGEELLVLQNPEQKDHASWLHVAIGQIMESSGYSITDLQAISVTSGPGSYTGLRVGMAAAKGFCYALNIPFITESTLTLMAFAAQALWKDRVQLLAPMIDARRMEVFTALYTLDLEQKAPPGAMLLDPDSFSGALSEDTILFFGSGSKKWQSIANSHNAFFADVPFHAGHLGILSEKKFNMGQFTDIISSEPAYIKEFHTHTKK
jgi:tRNA threonylcarbamoyladenosine biosynthesis protein TsaB